MHSNPTLDWSHSAAECVDKPRSGPRVVFALAAGDPAVTLSTARNNLGDTRAEAPTADVVVDRVAAAARFDELFPAARVDLVKIDVQGFEHLVVEGMLSALKRSPGAQVVLEFNPGMLAESGWPPVEVLANYRRMGFSILWLNQGALVSLSDADLVRTARSGGREGQLNLVLRGSSG